jgi:hypothetical protein
MGLRQWKLLSMNMRATPGICGSGDKKICLASKFFINIWPFSSRYLYRSEKIFENTFWRTMVMKFEQYLKFAQRYHNDVPEEMCCMEEDNHWLDLRS